MYETDLSAALRLGFAQMADDDIVEQARIGVLVQLIQRRSDSLRPD